MKSSECQTTHVMITSSALKGFGPQEMLEREYMKSQRRRVFVSPENILYIKTFYYAWQIIII